MSYEPKVGDEIEVVGPLDLMHALDDRWYGRTIITKVEKTRCSKSASGFHVCFKSSATTGRTAEYTVDVEAVRLVRAAASATPIDETVLALPDSDRQRIYKLLYNSGCRINR